MNKVQQAIRDVLLGKEKINNNGFIYKRIGNKYYLNSREIKEKIFIEEALLFFGTLIESDFEWNN